MNIKNHQLGFTLIEMLIVIIVLMILISVSTTLLMQEFKIFNVGKNLIAADWQGRIALERVTRDLRGAVSINNSNSGGSSIAFNDLSGNSLSYYLGGVNNQQLIYANLSTGFVSALADNIQGVVFNYYDQNGNGLMVTPANANGVRYVTVTVNVATNSNSNFNLTTAVYLWNIIN